MDENSNFKQDILEAAGNYPIIGVKILSCRDQWQELGSTRDKVPPDLLGKVISWKVAAPLLDYKYDTGYGAVDCHDIIAWTDTEVIYIYKYDGATSVCTLPRNPE